MALPVICFKIYPVYWLELWDLAQSLFAELKDYFMRKVATTILLGVFCFTSVAVAESMDGAGCPMMNGKSGTMTKSDFMDRQEMLFKKMDKNGDGVLESGEMQNMKKNAHGSMKNGKGDMMSGKKQRKKGQMTN